MAGRTAVIGRVALKVTPDTSDLRKKTKDDVKKATDGLEILIPLRADTDGLKEEVKAAVAEVNAEENDPIKVRLEVDDKALEELKARLAELHDETVNIKVGVEKQSLEDLMNDLRDAAKDSTANVKVKTDHSGLDAIIADMKKAMEDASDFKPHTGKTSLDLIAHDLEDTLAKSNGFNPKINHRAAKKLQDDMSKILQDGREFVAVNYKADHSGILRDLEKLQREVSFIDIKPGVKIDIKHAELAKLGQKIEAGIRDFDYKVPALDIDANTKGIREKLAQLRKDLLKSVKINFNADGLAKIKTDLLSLGGDKLIGIRMALDRASEAKVFADIKALSSMLKELAKTTIKLKVDSTPLKGVSAFISRISKPINVVFNYNKSGLKALRDSLSWLDVYRRIGVQVVAENVAKAKAQFAWLDVQRRIAVQVVTDGIAKAKEKLDGLAITRAVKFTANLAKNAASNVIGELAGITKIIKTVTRKVVIPIDAKADPVEIEKAIAEMRAKANARSIDLSVALQEHGVNAKLSEIIAKLKLRMDKAKINAAVGAELKDGDAVGVIAKMKGLFGTIKSKVDVTTESIAKARIKIAAGLKDIKAKVDVAVDNKGVQALGGLLTRMSGARLHYKLTFDSVEAAKNMDVMLPKIAALGTAMANLSSIAIAGTGSIFGYANQLISMGPGLVALPGIYMGIGAALAGVIVPLKNFKKEMPEVTAQFKGLGDAMTNAFYAQAKPAIESLANVTIPALKTGMAGLSGAEGGFFARLAGDLKKDVVPELIPFLNGISTAISRNTGLADGLSKAFGAFLKLGQTFVPQLIGFVSNLANEFGTLLQGAVKSGEAFKWVDTLKAGITDLFKGVLALVSIIMSVGKAANDAGLGGIHQLSLGLQGIAQLVKEPAVQNGMKNLFDSASTGVGNLVKGALPGLKIFAATVGNVLTKVLPEMGKAAGDLLNTLGRQLGSPQMRKSLTGAFDAIAYSVEKLLPFLNNLGDVFSAVLDVLANALKDFAPIVGRALDGVGPALRGLVKPLNQAVDGLTNGFGKILDALKPAAEEIIPTLGQAIGQLGKGVGDSLGQLAPTLGGVAKAIADLLAKNLPLLIDAIVNHLLPAVVTLIQKWGPMIIQIINGLSKALPPVIKFIADLSDKLKAWWGDSEATKWFDGIGKMISGFLGEIGGLFEAIDGLMTGDPKKLRKGVDMMMAACKDGVVKGINEMASAGWAKLKQFAQGCIDAVCNALGIHSPSKVFTEIGQWIVQGLINGVGNFAQAAWDKIADLAKGLWTSFQSAMSSTGDWLGGVVQSISTGLGGVATAISDWFSQHAQDLWNGFTSMASSAGGALQGLWGSISSAFDAVTQGIGTWISNALTTVSTGFTSIAQGAVNGLGDLWGKIKGAWDSVTTGIGTWFSGATASVLSGFNGIVTSASNGLANFWGRIVGAWDGVTSGIGNWFSAAWQKVLGGFNSIVGNAGNGLANFWGRISGAWGGVTSGIGNWFSAAWQKVLGGFNSIVGNAGNGLANFWGRIKGAWDGVISGIQGWFSSAWQTVSNGFSSVVGNAGNGLANFWGRIKGAWDSVSNGISGWFQNLWGNVKNWAGSVVGNVGNGLSGLWHTGLDAFNSLKDGMSQGWDSVVSWVRYLPNELAYAADWGGALVNAGWDLLSGLANSIYQNADRVVHAALRWLTNIIPSWKGPAPVDRKLLAPAGEMIMQSLVDGIESGAEGVREVLQNLTSEIQDSMNVSANVDLSASARNNAQAITSASAGVVSSSSAATSGSGVNVTQQIINPDPSVAARIASDQLKFALGV